MPEFPENIRAYCYWKLIKLNANCHNYVLHSEISSETEDSENSDKHSYPSEDENMDS